VFVNGFYCPILSSISVLPEGVVVGNLAEAIRTNNELVVEHLGEYAKPDKNSFVALNNAFIEDGALIIIPANVHLYAPIHLVFTYSWGNAPGKITAIHPRNLVIMGKGSSAAIIEDYTSDGSQVYLDNAVTELVVNDDAELDHYKIQRENTKVFHISNTAVHQGKGSRYVSHNLAFGSMLTRNDINVYLKGTEASCTLNGLYTLNETRHVDNHTSINHIAPSCRSSETYHGILDGASHGVFNGKIYVYPEAQKTDSRQTSHSLMLSNDSVIDAKPQLEIFADDVKCSHGATIGKLEEDSLYYLRSRGIDTEEARKMLILAFARKITGEFKLEPLKKEIETSYFLE
jgi:Fe-S cluster assembly protein SufD